MINLILFGPPGSGKGTQAVKIASKYGLKHVSTGDILRDQIKKQTSLGLKVQSIMEKGELVPDALLIEILDNVIAENIYTVGIIYDGFPRTINQASELDRLLIFKNTKVTAVLSLDVSDPEVVARLLKRAQIEGRKDDTEEVIKNRLNIYKKQTLPLLKYYEEKNKLNTINGVGEIEEIFNDLCKAIEAAM